MPFALTQLLVHKVPILLPCLATVNFISDSLIKDWQHANPLDIKCIFLLLSFGFRSLERSLNGICLYFITMSLPFVQLRTPVSLSTLLSVERALPHAAPQGWRRDYLAALKDLNCCKNIPNPKCKTYSGWQWIFVLKEKFPISNLLGRWHKQVSSSEQHPMDYNSKVQFYRMWLLWFKGDSAPICWGSGCCCWKPWENQCPISPLLLS